jgi:hypothetical protein
MHMCDLDRHSTTTKDGEWLLRIKEWRLQEFAALGRGAHPRRR